MTDYAVVAFVLWSVVLLVAGATFAAVVGLRITTARPWAWSEAPTAPEGPAALDWERAK